MKISSHASCQFMKPLKFVQQPSSDVTTAPWDSDTIIQRKVSVDRNLCGKMSRYR